MNMMGKMTRLYLSISLARMPNILVGGLAVRAGALATGGSRGARCCSEQTCRSALSLGRLSTPSLTVQDNMQQVWNLTQAWTGENIKLPSILPCCGSLRSNVFYFSFLKGSHWKIHSHWISRNSFNFLMQSTRNFRRGRIIQLYIVEDRNHNTTNTNHRLYFSRKENY